MPLLPPRTDAERLTLLGLWAVSGVGPKSVQAIREHTLGPLEQLLTLQPRDWASGLPLARAVRFALQDAPPLVELAEQLAEACHRAGISIAFPGDAAYPERLTEISDAPPLLFYLGTPSAPRRRVAMVGSRHPETNFVVFAKKFAEQVARGGVCIVSGAADGVDQACHHGAVEAGQVTWAFVASGLDELDASQATLAQRLLPEGGVIYSELPPGVRACREFFPRRNRLISGSSDAVLVLRAALKSGTFLTAEAAEKQGRPLLALPGDVRNEAAAGCNVLLKEGRAKLCNGPEDVWKAVGLRLPPELLAAPAPPGVQVDMRALSVTVQRAYECVRREPESFDALLERSGVSSSAALTSALCELELLGLVIQHPGKQYERV